MKKFALILIAIAMLPCSAWASRDSTAADTTVFKRGKTLLPRSTVKATPEDSVKWGTWANPFESVTSDTSVSKRFSKNSRGKSDTLATDSLSVKIAKMQRTKSDTLATDSLSVGVSKTATATVTGAFTATALVDSGDINKVAPSNVDTANAAWKWGYANIQVNSQDSLKIRDGSVSYADHAPLSIDSTKTRPSSISGSNLAPVLSGQHEWTQKATFDDTTQILKGSWGVGADGAKTIAVGDSIFEATTIGTNVAITLTSGNNLWRSSSTTTIGHAITVGRQIGQTRGSFPTTWGGPSIQLGDVLSALNTKSIPRPIRPGGNGTFLNGGILQIISQGNVAINAAILDSGSTVTSDGGGSGGLVVIVSAGTISGSSEINVSGQGGHAVAAARGGAGGYSGELGGNAGIGGSGGGTGYALDNTGGGGAGFISGKIGNRSLNGRGGGGGGSLDAQGSESVNYTGAAGGAGDTILANYATIPTIYRFNRVRPTTASSANGVAGESGAGGAGGTNGGGGGGGGGSTTNGQNGGAGGAATSTNPVGSGGGGGGGMHSADTTGAGGNGGAGSAGSPSLYVLSSNSPYAGLPGGQGGGGGGGGAGSWGGTLGTGAAGGAGVSGLSPFLTSMGAGSGGAGGTGATGGNGALTSVGGIGGAAGAGGNGGGAAGMVILIAPIVTYSGTVTGRLVVIEGDRAEYILRGIFKK